MEALSVGVINRIINQNDEISIPEWIRNNALWWSQEQIDDNTMRSYCRLQDTVTEAYVEIKVRLPDLEIIGAKGEFARSLRNECLVDINKSLKRVIGVRIGSGMLKIIKGLMGAETDCRELIFMVEECCQCIILAFTKETLLCSPQDEKDEHEYYADMVC